MITLPNNMCVVKHYRIILGVKMTHTLGISDPVSSKTWRGATPNENCGFEHVFVEKFA